jgi:hypothetical protein
MSASDNLRGSYLDAIGMLFEELTRDPAFESDLALKQAAIGAQSAAGVVEQRLSVTQTGNNPAEEKVFAAELSKAEAKLKTAVENFLAKTANTKSGSIISAAAAVEKLKQQFEKLRSS